MIERGRERERENERRKDRQRERQRDGEKARQRGRRISDNLGNKEAVQGKYFEYAVHSLSIITGEILYTVKLPNLEH